VTAYYLVDRQNNPDIFSLKGANALGTEFIILSQKDLGSAMSDGFNAAYILASENNTKVTITPSVDLVGRTKNNPFVITLSKGQVYVAAAANSAQIGNQIGGTFVSSDKPISIVLSDDSAKFQSAGCYDLNGDQLIPVCLAGVEYVTMPGSLNVNVGGVSNVTDIVYVYATEDDTQLTVNGQVISQKKNRGGDFRIYNKGLNNYIKSNKPVLIYQLGGNGCEVGGAVIPQMTRGGLDFSSAMRLTNENFLINILTKEEFKDDFEIIGISGNYSILWTTLSNNWVSGRIDLSNLSLVSVGNTIYFKNSAGNFHLGWINGGLGSGTRYGYFSNFSIALDESEVISSASDQEAVFSISDPQGSNGFFQVSFDAGVSWVNITSSSNDFIVSGVLNSKLTVKNAGFVDGLLVRYVEVSGSCSITSSISRLTIIKEDLSINLIKKANKNIYTLDDEIEYSFEVVNTGNLTLNDVKIVDALPGLSSISPQSVVLQPGQTALFKAKYRASIADMDKGQIVNIATAKGKGTNGLEITDSDTLSITADQKGDIKIEKSVDKPEVSAAGDKLVYAIKITNTGNVTLKNVVVEDAMLNSIENMAQLAPGESKTFTYSYTVTQVDMDNASGKLVNVAKGKGIDFNQTSVEDDATVTVSINQKGDIKIEKSVDKPEVSAAGDKLVYTIKITNTGNVTLKNVVVEDAMLNSIENMAQLAPGESKTFTYTYTVTQVAMDIASGKLVNVAKGKGIDVNQTSVEDDATVTVSINQKGDIKFEKSVDKTQVSAAGDKLVYTLKVTNTGNVTLKNVVVEDAMLNSIENLVQLAPGDSKSFTYTYTVRQVDMDSGGDIVNFAYAYAINIPKQTALATVTVLFSNILEFKKTVNLDSISSPQDLMYTITVKNTGNISHKNIILRDPLTNGTQQIKHESGDVNGNEILDVGETWIYKTSFSVMQEILNKEEDIINTAFIKTAQSDTLNASVKTKVFASDHYLEVPNVFTPNGDDVNDYFFPKFYNITKIHVMIMNKWGELIYESKDLKSDGWNGKLKSEDVPIGNYVFKIFYTSTSGRNYHKASVFLLER
jgi:gliding motility-associated-like protein/uncharacterized repeat protein (TIGR01451 family)